MKHAFVWIALAGAAALSGCDQIGLGPQRAASAPPPTLAPPPTANLRPFVGETFSAFAARPEFAAYAQALTLSGSDQARLSAAMAIEAQSWLAEGGGARALVFTGCAAEGCAAGRAVIALGPKPRAVFVGVRDAEGLTALSPNPRLEALLGLSSPNQSWDSPAPPAPAHSQP